MKTNYLFKARWLQGAASANESKKMQVNPRITPFRFACALMLILTFGVGNTWADTQSFNKDDFSSSTSSTKTPITVTFSAKTINNQQIRFNSGATVRFQSSAGNITSIAVTTNSTNAYIKDMGNTVTSGTWSGSGTSYAWTGSTTDITMTAGAACRITTITVTYTAASCTTNPTVSAGSKSSVTSTTATVSCSSGITSLGSAGCSISSYGFVIGTSTNPSIGGSGVTQHEVGTSYTTVNTSFSKNLTGLTASTTYYVRPYAINGNGTAYGTQTSFTTTALPKYTITYNAGTGTCGTSTWTQTSAGQSTTLPSASPSAGCSANDWKFAGWCTSSAGNEDENTTSPGDILTGSYTPTGNITLYAVYTKSGSGGTSYTSVSASEVTAGTYVIAALKSSTASSTYYAATGEVSSGDMTVESTGFTLTNGAFSTIPTGGIEFTFTGNNTDGFSINNGTGNLYYTSSENRKLAFQANNTTKWKIYDKTSPLNTNGIYIQNVAANYTISENSTGDGAIRGYASTTIYRAIYLFKKSSSTYYMTNLACSSCSYTVTLSKGSETNGTFTMTPAAGTRNNCTTGLVVTVSDISPNSGYEFVEVTESNGITPTDNGDGTYTITYTADQSYTSTVGVTFRQLCETPTFTPGAGTYTSSQNVTISCATNEAVIHYTTDGSTPTASSPTYNGAITVSEDMTIKAIATKANYGNSEVASAAYKILDCDWYESFDETNGTGGNDGQYSGNIATSTKVEDNTGWDYANSGGGKQCIKVSTGNAGHATTPALGLSGNLILKYRAAGFGTDGTSISLSVSTGSISVETQALTNSSWGDYTAEISDADETTTITFSSAGSKRFFLDDVCVKQGSSTYHVTYNANSGSGTAPTDNTDYARNSSVTVLGNTGNLAKIGWTFAGWNTAADGSGTPYAAGNTFSITSNVTLYAMWTCTVTWSVNENTSACSPETITYDPSGNKVKTVPSPDPSNYCGDVFVGWHTDDDEWNTAPDGTFTNVAGSPNIDGDITFYAVFADYAAE